MNLDQQTQRRWGVGTGLAMAASLLLAGLSFGTPESVGCGGVPPVDDSATTSTGILDGALASRLKAPVKLLLVWDLPDGSAWKFGEGTAAAGNFSLNLGSPPDEVVHGAVGIAHLVAVPPSKVVADGRLSLDDADDLAQGALGVLGGAAVIYKQGDSDAYPWLASFPLGVSCAQAQVPGPGARTAGGTALGGYARVACRGLTGAMTALEDDAFVNWSVPPPVGRVLGH